MSGLLRLVALFFRALTAFDRWLTAADPGEDGIPVEDEPCVLTPAERAEFEALTDPIEAEIDGRPR